MAECQRYDREFVIICVSRCSILLAARFTHNHDDATFWRYNYDYARILTKCVGFANTPRAVFQILCFCYGRRVCAYVAHTREVPTCITGVVITNTWSSNMSSGSCFSRLRNAHKITTSSNSISTLYNNQRFALYLVVNH